MRVNKLIAARLFLGITALGLFLCGCELTYDPSFSGDAPASPGVERPQRFIYREKVVPPFTVGDLTKTMPLSKLLDIALYNNPITRVSWNAARAAAFNYHVALSEEYPTITYTGSMEAQVSNGAVNISGAGGAIIANGSTTTTTTTTTTTSSSSSTETVETVFNQLTLSYLLMDFGGRAAQEDLAYQMLIQANWQHNLAMQNVMLSVINFYTSYISNKALVLASEKDLKDAQVLLAAAIKMKENGLATLTDVLSAQSTLEQFRFNLEQARGAEKTSLAELLIALGLPPNTDICIQDLPEKLPVIEIAGDICTLIELAKEKKPDIGAAIAQVKQQEANLKASISAGLPALTVNGSAARVNFVKPKIPSIFNNSIALDWTSPIFSGFLFVNQQKEIRAQIAEAIANVDETVAEVVTEVVVNYYAFTTAEAALPSSEAVLEFSQRTYRGMLSQYKVGTAAIQDVVTALTTLSNARSQQILTRAQWAASLANLAFSVGVLEDDGGIWMDKPPKKLYQVKYNDDKKLGK
jgi:outer membrane protein